MHDQPGRRAGCEEREIVGVRRRRDRDEAVDLRPPHQQLHADPGAEREAAHPGDRCIRIDGLEPVERRRGIREFALAAREPALRTPDPAEVEPENRKPAPCEGVKHRSEEHTSELQSLVRISYAVFCLKKKTKTTTKA